MTVEELRQLTDYPFEYLIQRDDPEHSILFGIPIPAPFGDGLHWHKSESGCSFTVDEDIKVWEDAWNAYIRFLQEQRNTPAAETGPKHRNRTRQQAEQAGAITFAGMPCNLANVTLVPYRQAMTVVENEDARLQPILPELASNLRFENGVLWFEGMDASRVNLVRYYDRRPQAVMNLDLITLRALYSIILQDVQRRAATPETLLELVADQSYINRLTSIYLPDFLKMLGYQPNISQDSIQFAITKIASYNRILGCLKDESGGRKHESIYTVLNFDHYDKNNGTLHFYSPYINKLIAIILSKSIQTDRKNQPKRTKSGKPILLPSHSYNIRSSIVKERNLRSVEIVFVIEALIAEAGDDHTPHIRAQTMIDRVPDLKFALEAAEKTKDKNILLKRAFSKAWELLETQTDLRKNYKNIQFPTVVPTTSTLDMIFTFPHEGKVKPPSKKGKGQGNSTLAS